MFNYFANVALFYAYFAAAPELNRAPKDHAPSELDKFSILLAVARCYLYYYNTDVIAEVFLNGIENLPEKASKTQLESVQAQTKDRLA